MKKSSLLLSALLIVFFSCKKDIESASQNETIGSAKLIYTNNTDSLIFPIVKKYAYDSTSFNGATSGNTYKAFFNNTDTNYYDRHLEFSINEYLKVEIAYFLNVSTFDSLGNWSGGGAMLIDTKEKNGNSLSNFKDYDVSVVVNSTSNNLNSKELNSVKITLGKNQNLFININQFDLILRSN